MFRRLTIARLAGCCHGLAICAVLLTLTGCAGPMGVTRVSPQESYRYNTDTAFGGGEISNSTRAVLQRYDLLKKLEDDRQQAIQTLAEISTKDDRRDLLFALSELYYLEGELLQAGHSEAKRRQAPDMFLQAVVYAYHYLLGEGREAPPTAYDIRFRNACDLYNRALWRAFPTDDKGGLQLAGGVRQLPAGVLALHLKTDALAWDVTNIALLPADAYAVRGFTVRNRTPGLGLPLVGLTPRTTESPNGGALPITAFLRVHGTLRDYQQGGAQADLELYSALDDAEVWIKDRAVPLETDITTPLAYKLEELSPWHVGVKGFITGAEGPARLLLIQPYEPGRIPVVFVHGTASNPAWWAEMFNSLRGDPLIRKHFQFWFYRYNSSGMLMLSAADLRESITRMVAQLDPEQQDPALRNMVVIGHSQGGLLTKMTVVEPGDKLWNAISDTPIEAMQLDQERQDFVRRLLLFEPLPLVKRVVYISTPHRGSFLTKGWVRILVRKIISLPKDALLNSQAFFTSLDAKLKLPSSIKGKMPTSIDGMSEDNPLLNVLTTVPLKPGVTAHSIIAVKPGMDIATGDDGVVTYQSAHVDGVESEFIVRSEHSCQSHPFAIEEVRRILLKHLGRDDAWRPPSDAAEGQGTMRL